MTVGEKDKEIDDKKTYKEAFDDFDWNKNGTIPTRVNAYTVKFTIFVNNHFEYFSTAHCYFLHFIFVGNLDNSHQALCHNRYPQ